MTVIDGKKISEEIQQEIAEQVSKMKAAGMRVPHLAAVLVGNDGASETYVGGKVKACEKVGFNSTLVRLAASVSEKELLDKINELNRDENIDGFIVQLPLPAHISERKVTEAIDPVKDVDGFHPSNVGR
ncbi:MAG TPA: tetrahydrofolate dehydrogenase/cyclohydrolase catalytic domain-containing protein, partial [Bacteroidia bacterium]